MLPESPPKFALAHQLRAGEISSHDNLRTLNPIDSVDRIYRLLKKTKHGLFPVIYPENHTRAGQIYGTILRQSLIALIKIHAISESSSVDKDPLNPKIISPVLSFQALQKIESQLHDVDIE